MKWAVSWYYENAEGGNPPVFIVAAETREEAIKKAPHDWRDPNKLYFSANQIKEEA